LLSLMSEIGQTLIKAQPLTDVLDRVIGLTFDNVAAERAFLMLVEGTAPPAGDAADREAARPWLVPRVVRHRDGSVPERASISSTLVRRVMTDRVALLASDARVDPRLDTAHSIQLQNIRSLMCAPLWNRSEVIGILYVDTPRSRQFTEMDLSLFTSLANYAAVAIDQARLFARVLEESRRRERLQRYHSPAVVDRILETTADVDMPLTAQERDVTVMFADIVGFSTLAEGLPPPQVALLLNNFFSRMADVIFEHGGTLDKFIGDAVMAVFGAPFDQPDHARRGVDAARGMRRALALLNEERPEIPLQMRIALHSGVAMAGDIGSPKRREYTVLGDVVNTASRLESTIARPGQIVISGATYERVRDAVPARSLGKVTVRGRTAEIDVFEIED
jgi:adenylate cyclase